MSAIQVKGDIRDYYQRKVGEGKNKMSVLNAVRNKLVHRVCSVVHLLGDFARKGIHFKALDLGVDSSTPAGKLTVRRAVLQIFAALAEYDRESILEKTRAGQLLAKANGKHIGRPAGLDAEKSAKVKKALERGLSVAETVSLTGISKASVKRYRKQIENTSF